MCAGRSWAKSGTEAVGPLGPAGAIDRPAHALRIQVPDLAGPNRPAFEIGCPSASSFHGARNDRRVGGCRAPPSAPAALTRSRRPPPGPRRPLGSVEEITCIALRLPVSFAVSPQPANSPRNASDDRGRSLPRPRSRCQPLPSLSVGMRKASQSDGSDTIETGTARDHDEALQAWLQICRRLPFEMRISAPSPAMAIPPERPQQRRRRIVGTSPVAITKPHRVAGGRHEDHRQHEEEEGQDEDPSAWPA